jgi:hypothetical protein
LAIVLCISKLQADLLNQKFLLLINCKAAKSVLQKDVQNLASKYIFARWLLDGKLFYLFFILTSNISKEAPILSQTFSLENFCREDSHASKEKRCSSSRRSKFTFD